MKKVWAELHGKKRMIDPAHYRDWVTLRTSTYNIEERYYRFDDVLDEYTRYVDLLALEDQG